MPEARRRYLVLAAVMAVVLFAMLELVPLARGVYAPADIWGHLALALGVSAVVVVPLLRRERRLGGSIGVTEFEDALLTGSPPLVGDRVAWLAEIARRERLMARIRRVTIAVTLVITGGLVLTVLIVPPGSGPVIAVAFLVAVAAATVFGTVWVIRREEQRLQRLRAALD